MSAKTPITWRIFSVSKSLGDEYAPSLNGDDNYTYLPQIQRSTGDPDKKLEALQNTAAQGISLNDSLIEQWRMVEADEKIKAAGEQIIDYLDEKGYLTIQLEQLHNKDKHDFGIEHLQQALTLVQKLEPAGVGARNVQECLTAADGPVSRGHVLRNADRSRPLGRVPR